MSHTLWNPEYMTTSATSQVAIAYPSQVTDFVASDGDAPSSLLTWINPDIQVDRIRICRSMLGYPDNPSEGVVTVIESPTPLAVGSYVDSNLVNSVYYYYAVFSQKDGVWNLSITGENSDFAVTPPQVNNVNATDDLYNSIVVSWLNPINFDQIMILRKIGGYAEYSNRDNNGVKKIILGNVNNYTDTDVKEDEVYYYSVFTRYQGLWSKTRSNENSDTGQLAEAEFDTLVANFDALGARHAVQLIWFNVDVPRIDKLILMRNSTNMLDSYNESNYPAIDATGGVIQGEIIKEFEYRFLRNTTSYYVDYFVEQKRYYYAAFLRNTDGLVNTDLRVGFNADSALVGELLEDIYGESTVLQTKSFITEDFVEAISLAVPYSSGNDAIEWEISNDGGRTFYTIPSESINDYKDI